MLSKLSISNYILIDSLEISFPGGLGIITGQTGAGKSILLGALSLLTGAKADASMISEGADSCVVEGEFSLPNGSLRPLLEENEVEWDGGELIIRRVLNRSGRTRSFINDSPVPLGVLSEVGKQLVDIHSQHQTALLADSRFQLSVLDYFAGNDALLKECSDAWKLLITRQKELSEAEERLSKLSSERDYVQARYKTLNDAGLREGELAELEEEQKKLANAESIKEALQGVQNIFSPEEGMSVDASLKEAGRLLEKASAYIPSLGDLPQRLHSLRVELDDISSTAATEDERLVFSSERLAEVEDRMSLIYSLLQRFSCSSEAALIALRDEYSKALFDSESLVERVQECKAAVKKARQEHNAICEKLHASRLAAAPKFAASLSESLRFLELDDAVFEVEVSPCQAGASGSDAVNFLFDAAGKHPVDVAKCASGGERSRIMLCLKALMAKFTGMPTMIFDEIDTGVSGSAADKMGTMICEMGENMQLIAITHLPQVAAKGSAHFVVEKSGKTTIRRLEGESRIMEIARLLSGERITPEAIANAKSLLRQ